FHVTGVQTCALPISLRPALLPAGAENDFRELLGFRHLARHAYDVEPEPARMIEHGDRVARIPAAITTSMAGLVTRLRSAPCLQRSEERRRGKHGSGR